MLANAPSDSLPTQLVHGDFRAANVLFVGSDVRAVLDFEAAGLGYRVDDLARSAVLLGTLFREWGPVSSEVRSGFLDGYRSVCPLTPERGELVGPSRALVLPGAHPRR